MTKFIFLLVIFFYSIAHSKELVQFDCGGTEPNWGLKIRNQRIDYAAPDKEIPNIKVTETKLKDKKIQLKAKSPTGNIFNLEISEDRKCSDGMSEQSSTHLIKFSLDKENFSGCCNLTK